MPELKAYDVSIHGVDTSLLLDADDAEQRGLGEKDLRSYREKQAAKSRRPARKVAAGGGTPDLVIGGGGDDGGDGDENPDGAGD